MSAVGISLSRMVQDLDQVKQDLPPERDLNEESYPHWFLIFIGNLFYTGTNET